MSVQRAWHEGGADERDLRFAYQCLQSGAASVDEFTRLMDRLILETNDYPTVLLDLSIIDGPFAFRPEPEQYALLHFDGSTSEEEAIDGIAVLRGRNGEWDGIEPSRALRALAAHPHVSETFIRVFGIALPHSPAARG